MISHVIELILFADDTNLFLHDISLSALEQRLNLELENLSTWFKVNKLFLNLKKTNYMIFTQKRNITDTLMNIKIDNVPIQKVHQTRFLGVIIIDKLLWDDHIKTTRIKISKRLRILAKLRHCLPSHILVNVYYTLVHPYFDYCNIIWATGTSTSLNNLFLLRKKAMRIITNSSWRPHTAPIFNKLKVLTLFDINKLQTVCFMFKVFNQQLPNYFNDLFIPNSNIHNYNTVLLHNSLPASDCMD